MQHTGCRSSEKESRMKNEKESEGIGTYKKTR
jgi:hypothetical protein